MMDTSIYFYLKDKSILKKYKFEIKDDWQPDYYHIWGKLVWLIKVHKDTLRVQINKVGGIALACEMYKNGDLIILDHPLYTEEAKIKAKKKLDAEIEKLKKEYERKYGD